MDLQDTSQRPLTGWLISVLIFEVIISRQNLLNLNLSRLHLDKQALLMQTALLHLIWYLEAMHLKLAAVDGGHEELMWERTGD